MPNSTPIDAAAVPVAGASTVTAPAATPVLDAVMTLALAQAADAAYMDFAGQTPTLPSAWSLIDHWTGWDPDPFGGREERYGLLLGRNDAPGEVIFAFRGTASLDDALDDADFPTREFVATQGAAPTGALVASGFYGVYNDVGGNMALSMRAQLTRLLAQTAPTRIWITGHSLGGALAHLFAFDLSFGPHASAFHAMISLASPRVGLESWRDAYLARIPAQRSIRVYNQHDLVPELPPRDFGFHDVGTGFPTAFERRLLPDLYPLSRHSLVNLTTVLQHALPAQPQTWAGTFADARDAQREMVSTVPKPAGVHDA